MPILSRTMQRRHSYCFDPAFWTKIRRDSLKIFCPTIVSQSAHHLHLMRLSFSCIQPQNNTGLHWNTPAYHTWELVKIWQVAHENEPKK